MPNLSDEEQCMLSLMEIAGFPVRVENGLFTWNEREAGFPPRMGQDSRSHSTANLSDVVSIFEFWKKHHGEN